MGSILYLESNPASAPEPTAQEVERVAPSAAAVGAAAAALPECTDRRPAVWSHAGVPQVVALVVRPGASVAPGAPVQGGVRQVWGARAFCLPVRPGSRRCCHSPQTIP